MTRLKTAARETVRTDEHGKFVQKRLRADILPLRYQASTVNKRFTGVSLTRRKMIRKIATIANWKNVANFKRAIQNGIRLDVHQVMGSWQSVVNPKQLLTNDTDHSANLKP